MANLTVTATSGNDLTVQVVPVPAQTIQISRGVKGVPGPPGPNEIGGYPINVSTLQNYDALMFVSNEWVNVNQLEIADGGNF